MAMGIGAAHLIAENKDKLKGNVVMFFQPGEEGHDGAGLMLAQDMHLASGEMPIAAFGLHVFSIPEPGLFLSRKGTMMASAGDILVTLKGRGGHGSMPWAAKDPITGMVEILSSLQSYIAKNFDALDPIVLNVGWIKAGNDHTTNIVPETVSFGATVRSFSKKGYDDTRTKIPAFIKSMAAAFCLGADAVQVGSRFAATAESSAHPSFKQAIVQAGDGDTQLTLKELTPVRLLKNKFYRDVMEAYSKDASADELAALLGRGSAKKGMFEGDMDEGELEIGQVSATIHNVKQAGDVVHEMLEEYRQTLAGLKPL
jgi:amidohydrolase